MLKHLSLIFLLLAILVQVLSDFGLVPLHMDWQLPILALFYLAFDKFFT